MPVFILTFTPIIMLIIYILMRCCQDPMTLYAFLITNWKSSLLSATEYESLCSSTSSSNIQEAIFSA